MMAKIAITGARGFIGQNLAQKLRETNFDVLALHHDSPEAEWREKLSQAQIVFHLAGVNRPEDPAEFRSGNLGATERLLGILASSKVAIPVVYASSIQAAADNAYGQSKMAAENALAAYEAETGARTFVFRLPNVFGKWCRPNYNSVVATFCYNVARGLPLKINDPSTPLRLVYVDDVVDRFISIARDLPPPQAECTVEPVYQITVGDLAARITAFRDSRTNLLTGRVGEGLARALHSTYVSYLEPSQFDYALTPHTDARGTFVEMLRTPDCGQFSYFTAHPGVTRGGHYHHSKTEKFLVIQGSARFGFRHILTGERVEILTSGDNPRVVETVPGWAHDITNVGTEMLVVMLWANEMFDKDKPDTFAAEV